MTSHDACTSGNFRVLTIGSLQWLKMEVLIPAPADCEVRSLIKFLNAQSIAPVEIHHQLCYVYRSDAMSKQLVRRWCRQFTADRQHVHGEDCSGRPSIITYDLVELVREHMEKCHFTVTKLSSHFPQISRSLLHKIVTENLLFRKLCARWVPKQLTPEHEVKSKAHGVSIYISAALPWWRWRVSGPDHYGRWSVGCTHCPRYQAAVNVLIDQYFCGIGLEQ